ncbi:GAF domain-containing protein [Beggiatoa leptomitoformis]|nr:GAF domain-containing protein [Beggiatoa leptomitoformis]
MTIKLSTLNLSTLLLLGMMTVLLTGSVIYMQQTLQEKDDILEEQARIRQLGIDFINAMEYLTDEARKFVMTYDERHIQRYAEEVYFIQTREKVLNIVNTLRATKEEIDLLATIKQTSDLLKEKDIHAMRLVLTSLNMPVIGIPEEISNYPLTDIERLAEAGDKLNIARTLLFDRQYDTLKQQIIQPIKRFQLLVNQRITQEINLAHAKVKKAIIILISIAILIPFSVLILLFIFWKQVSLPISNYIHALKKHTDKTTEFTLHPQGIRELHLLADAFNQQLQDNHEQLQKNRQLMQESQQNNRMLIKQDWLKTGQTQLNNLLVGEQDEVRLARHILQFLLNYLDLQSGLFYLSDMQTVPQFKLIASEGGLLRHQLDNLIPLGQGLVGQAALEQKIIFLTHSFIDNPFITKELQEITPAHFLAVPFMYENQLKGVVSLGAMVEFNELQVEFLEQIMPNMGIIFHTIQTNLRLKVAMHNH